MKNNKMKYLVGGQAKLDKNKNNRIDAEDFKILRGEKKKPGKMMKARRGTIIKPRGPGVIRPKPQDRYGQPMKPKPIKPRIQKKMGGGMMMRRPMGLQKGGPFSSLEEMRKSKGFKPGETPAQFNKRKAMMKRAAEAARATKVGKIVLPIALAGVSAIQFLKSKMKKKDKKPKKKMGGGLMEATQRLKAQGKMGGGMMRRPMMAKKGKLAALAKKKGLPAPLVKSPKGFFKSIGVFPAIAPKKKMGGGMMMRPNPVGMKSGKSVKVKCKLGRNKPTKMY